MRSILVAFVAASLAVPFPAAAEPGSQGVQVEIEFFENGGETPSHRATVLAAGRRLRIEQQASESGTASPTFVYRGDRDRLYSIADGARSYVELEPMLLSLLVGQTNVARREVSGSLEALPQDQQRAVGRLLGVAAIDPKRPDDPMIIARTGEVDEVSGLACRRVTLSVAGRVLAKGCVADWDTVGLTSADVEVFRSLASIVRTAADSRAPIPIELIPGQPLDLVVQFGGFPLEFERAGKVAGANAIRVATVETVKVADSQFEVPEGYAARSGVSGIAALAGMLSIQGGTPSRAVPEVPSTVEPESDQVMPAAMDPAAAVFAPDREPEPARPAGRPDHRSIRLFDDSE